VNHHRLSKLVESYPLPRPPMPAITANTFAAYPAVLLRGLSDAELLWQQSVYELAFAQAQADLTPSLCECDLAGVWN